MFVDLPQYIYYISHLLRHLSSDRAVFGGTSGWRTRRVEEIDFYWRIAIVGTERQSAKGK